MPGLPAYLMILVSGCAVRDCHDTSEPTPAVSADPQCQLFEVSAQTAKDLPYDVAVTLVMRGRAPTSYASQLDAKLQAFARCSRGKIKASLELEEYDAPPRAKLLVRSDRTPKELRLHLAAPALLEAELTGLLWHLQHQQYVAIRRGRHSEPSALVETLQYRFPAVTVAREDRDKPDWDSGASALIVELDDWASDVDVASALREAIARNVPVGLFYSQSRSDGADAVTALLDGFGVQARFADGFFRTAVPPKLHTSQACVRHFWSGVMQLQLNPKSRSIVLVDAVRAFSAKSEETDSAEARFPTLVELRPKSSEAPFLIGTLAANTFSPEPARVECTLPRMPIEDLVLERLLEPAALLALRRHARDQAAAPRAAAKWAGLWDAPEAAASGDAAPACPLSPMLRETLAGLRQPVHVELHLPSDMDVSTRDTFAEMLRSLRRCAGPALSHNAEDWKISISPKAWPEVAVEYEAFGREVAHHISIGTPEQLAVEIAAEISHLRNPRRVVFVTGRAPAGEDPRLISNAFLDRTLSIGDRSEEETVPVERRLAFADDGLADELALAQAVVVHADVNMTPRAVEALLQAIERGVPTALLLAPLEESESAPFLLVPSAMSAAPLFERFGMTIPPEALFDPDHAHRIHVSAAGLPPGDERTRMLELEWAEKGRPDPYFLAGADFSRQHFLGGTCSAIETRGVRPLLVDVDNRLRIRPVVETSARAFRVPAPVDLTPKRAFTAPAGIGPTRHLVFATVEGEGRNPVRLAVGTPPECARYGEFMRALLIWLTEPSALLSEHGKYQRPDPPPDGESAPLVLWSSAEAKRLAKLTCREDGLRRRNIGCVCDFVLGSVCRAADLVTRREAGPAAACQRVADVLHLGPVRAIPSKHGHALCEAPKAEMLVLLLAGERWIPAAVLPWKANRARERDATTVMTEESARFFCLESVDGKWDDAEDLEREETRLTCHVPTDVLDEVSTVQVVIGRADLLLIDNDEHYEPPSWVEKRRHAGRSWLTGPPGEEVLCTELRADNDNIERHAFAAQSTGFVEVDFRACRPAR